MSCIFCLCMAPFVWCLVVGATYIFDKYYEHVKEERTMEEQILDTIMDEVRTYNFHEVKSPQPQKVKTKTSATKTKTKKQTPKPDIYQMSMLKSFCLGAAVAVCGYFELMKDVLFVPIMLVCLCNICFQLGIRKGAKR